ncbi:MAG TPA: T9SS type A sorting domain-containing protein, partial [Bacteroidetes bacterium]|nr:T9SS type A sorting domain-containing protein [Bacteroidota bacterium]
HASQNTTIAHFGLGNATQADNLVIEWPSGGRQVLTNVPPNQILFIEEDPSLFTSVKNILKKNGLHVWAAPNPFAHHTNIFFLNKKSKKLNVRLCDATGRVYDNWTTTAQQLEISGSGLPPGFYFLKIFSENILINVLKLYIAP